MLRYRLNINNRGTVMNENTNTLIFLGFIWFIVNQLYVNSCIQEDNGLKKELVKISHSPDENMHIPSMSRNTRSALGLGIASIGILIGLLLIRSTRALQTLATNEATPARPSENTVNQINNPPSSSFFRSNNFSGDTVIPEQNNTQEQKTNSPK